MRVNAPNDPGGGSCDALQRRPLLRADVRGRPPHRPPEDTTVKGRLWSGSHQVTLAIMAASHEAGAAQAWSTSPRNDTSERGRSECGSGHPGQPAPASSRPDRIHLSRRPLCRSDQPEQPASTYSPSEWWISCTSAPCRRRMSAMRSASQTSETRMWLASCQPTTRREKTLMTNAKKTIRLVAGRDVDHSQALDCRARRPRRRACRASPGRGARGQRTCAPGSSARSPGRRSLLVRRCHTRSGSREPAQSRPDRAAAPLRSARWSVG